MAWLSGWKHRAKIEITGSDEGELTNYQVDITVNYESGKMKPDFEDIRFTDIDGETLLNYHLVEKTDEESALFTVKIPVIPESPDTLEIYFYSGNPEATTTSNPYNVYLIYDDFTEEDNWNDLGGGQHSISNGRLYLSDTGSEGVIYHDTSIPNNIEIQYSVYSASTDYWADFVFFHNGSNIQYGYLFSFNNSDSSLWEGTGSYSLISGGWSFGGCCGTIKIKRVDNNIKAYLDGTQKFNIDDSTFPGGGKIGFRQVLSRNKVISEVIVRKTSPYPPNVTGITEWETSNEFKGCIEVEYYTAALKGLITVRQETAAHLKGFLCVQHFYKDLKGILSVRTFSTKDLKAYLYVSPYIKRYKYCDVNGEITVEEIGPYKELRGEIIVDGIFRKVIPVRGRILRETPQFDPTDPSGDKELDEKMTIMIGDGIYV